MVAKKAKPAPAEDSLSLGKGGIVWKGEGVRKWGFIFLLICAGILVLAVAIWGAFGFPTKILDGQAAALTKTTAVEKKVGELELALSEKAKADDFKHSQVMGALQAVAGAVESHDQRLAQLEKSK